MIPAPIFRCGALRVEDEWTIVYLHHRLHAEVNRSFVVGQVLSPVLLKKMNKLVKVEAQWRSPCH